MTTPPRLGWSAAERNQATAFRNTDPWRVMRIMGEFVHGFDALASIGPAVTIFGSARVKPGSPTWDQAEELAAKLAREGLTVITGGGPGIMEAANKGAQTAGGESVGIGIDLPFEQGVNQHVTLPLKFHYFFVRKTMFVKYAKAFVFMPGGFGTLDELFETLTLVQTGKRTQVPLVLIGTQYWSGLLDWLRDQLQENALINEGDIELMTVTDDLDVATNLIVDFINNCMSTGQWLEVDDIP